MKYKVIYMEQADKDLRAIYEYIAFTLFVPDAAAGQLGRIEKAIIKLQEMPERYRLYEEEPWRSRGLRWMPVDNFIAFYIPLKEDKIVAVIRVLYKGSNIKEQLTDYNKKLATNELMDKLDKGQKSGGEKGWTFHEDMRTNLKE
jgi:toxin ParE1/3/4